LGCLSQALISEAARWNSFQKHSVDPFMAAATQDLCDQGGLLVQFACHIQIIATCNKAIFHVDGILAKDSEPMYSLHRQTDNPLKTLVNPDEGPTADYCFP
jgi:hypothetical protein